MLSQYRNNVTIDVTVERNNTHKPRFRKTAISYASLYKKLEWFEPNVLKRYTLPTKLSGFGIA